MNPNNHDNTGLPAQLPLRSVTQGASAFANLLATDSISLPSSLSRGDSIEVLGLPIRLENALRNSGDITTVGQFVDTTDEKLLKLRNIGQKSLNYLTEMKKDISERLDSLQDENHVKRQEVYPEKSSIPADLLITSLIERCGSERVREIIKRRYGLMNGERQTLEEIGEYFGVTRERIRQIQVKAMKLMKHPITAARKPLTDITESVLFQSGGIISAEEADTIIPKALGNSDNDGSSVLDLMSDLGWVQSCRIGDITVYSPKLDDISLCKLSEKITALIRKQDLGIDVAAIVRGVALFRRVKERRFNPHEFVLKYCRIDPRTEEIGLSSEQPEIIFRYYTSAGHFAKKGWVTLMTRVLEQEQMPLHFTEIANKVNDLLSNSDRQLEVRRAHSILIDDEAFAHSGIHGTYGLTSWGFRRETTPQLIEECMKKAGFPIHWKQIYNYVSKFKNSKSGSITSVLETNRMFRRVDNGIYWFREEQ